MLARDWGRDDEHIEHEAGWSDRDRVDPRVRRGTHRSVTRDSFCRTLLAELSQTLDDVVGAAKSAGFVSLVGHEMGRQLNDADRASLGVDRRR